jgi:hypothetical protein
LGAAVCREQALWPELASAPSPGSPPRSARWVGVAREYWTAARARAYLHRRASPRAHGSGLRAQGSGLRARASRPAAAVGRRRASCRRAPYLAPGILCVVVVHPHERHVGPPLYGVQRSQVRWTRRATGANPAQPCRRPEAGGVSKKWPSGQPQRPRVMRTRHQKARPARASGNQATASGCPLRLRLLRDGSLAASHRPPRIGASGGAGHRRVARRSACGPPHTGQPPRPEGEDAHQP